MVLPFLVLIAILAGARWPRDPLLIVHCMVTGFLIHGVYLGGVFWAIDVGMPASAGVLIVGLQPVLTALVASALLGEELGRKHWIGVALGSAGLVLVLAPKLGLAGSGITLATVAAVFVAVLAISIGTVYQKKFVPQTDLISATVWQYIGALACTLPMTHFESWSVVWSPDFIFALLWLVFVLSIGAVLLLMLLIRHGAVSEVASLFYLVPVATAIESYFLFGETLEFVQLGGMLLVVFAILIIRRSPRRA